MEHHGSATSSTRLMRNKLLLALVLILAAYFSVHATAALGAKSASQGSSDAGRRLLAFTDHAADARALWGRAHSKAKDLIVHRQRVQAPSWETELLILEGVPKRKLQSVNDAEVTPTLYETGTNRRRVLHQQQAATAPRVFRPAA